MAVLVLRSPPVVARVARVPVPAVAVGRLGWWWAVPVAVSVTVAAAHPSKSGQVLLRLKLGWMSVSPG